MKTRFYYILTLLTVSSRLVASPEDMPFITARMDADQKRLDGDAAAGTISKDDADKLSARISHVRTVVDTETRMTAATRRGMREDMGRIEKDIADKEQAAKAGASASPSASP